VRVSEALALLMDARAKCDSKRRSGGAPQSEESERVNLWYERHTTRIYEIVHDYMPDGARIYLDASNGEKLVFTLPDHEVTVTASLRATGYRLRITGRNINGAKNKIRAAFLRALDTEVKA
jgi:hypothetical protein